MPGYKQKDMATPENKALFLEKLAELCHVGQAALAVGVKRQRVYDWAEDDPEFKEKWKVIRDGIIADAFEDEAIRRGYHGVDEPIFYQGERAGEWVDSKGNPVMAVSIGGSTGWTYPSGIPVPEGEAVCFRQNVIRRYSDTMLAMLLNGAKPEKYRQRHEHSGNVTVRFTSEDAGVL